MKTMSTMKVAVVLVIVAVIPSMSGDVAGECSMAGFYLELGCTPMPGANSTCPEAFSCPQLQPDPKMCFYRGKAYSDGTSLPQNVMLNPCAQACYCHVGEDKPRFDCASVDCFETFDSDMKEECINTFELDSCCSTGNICGKDEIMQLKKCEVNGQTFLEGQSFEPKNTHKTCICTEDFDGTYDNVSYCRDLNCGVEIYYQSNIFSKCAPVFYGSRVANCPIAFQCPDETTKILRGVNPRSISTQCVFGNMTLSVGDEVTSSETEKCVTCSCDVPPLVSCTKKNNCEETETSTNES